MTSRPNATIYVEKQEFMVKFSALLLLP